MTALNLETVDCERVDGVAWVTLNRPDALNAWIRQLGVDLQAALDTAADDPEVRAIVLTGAGRAFSSGADLKAGGELQKEGGGFDVLTPLREVYNPAILRVRTMPKPVIAAVNGPAVGIGCSLALAADLVVAARSAYFLLAFVNIGLGLDGGASQSLAARVGHARAMEMAMLGERIGAEQALDWGLANRVVDDEQLRPGRDRAGPAPGRRPARLLRDDQAHDQRPHLRRLRRDPRPRGPAPAGARGLQGLHGGRRVLRAEAPAQLHRGIAMNLAQTILDAARQDPDHVAVKLDDAELSYRMLDGATAHLAGLLRAHGVKPGDRVGIMLPNVPYFPVCYYGILRAGAIVVPMNVLLKKREVAFYLKDPEAKLLFAWDDFAEAAETGAEEAGAECVLIKPGEFENQVGAAEPLTEVADTGDDDTAVILYTSGTTGQPKGAELTHANLTRNAEASRGLFGLGSEAVVLGALPLFHTFGQTCGMNATLGGGGTLTLIPRFDPAKALEIIQRDQVNVFQGVPTMYGAMLHHPSATTSTSPR